MTGPCFWCTPKGGSLVTQDQVMWQDRWCPLKTRNDCLETIPPPQCCVALTKHHRTRWRLIWERCAAGTMVLKFQKPSGVFGVHYTDTFFVVSYTFYYWRRVGFHKAQKQSTSLNDMKDLNEQAVICKITGEWEKLTLLPCDLWSQFIRSWLSCHVICDLSSSEADSPAMWSVISVHQKLTLLPCDLIPVHQNHL